MERGGQGRQWRVDGRGGGGKREGNMHACLLVDTNLEEREGQRFLTVMKVFLLQDKVTNSYYYYSASCDTV